MAIFAHIVDAYNRKSARVSKSGELAVAPLSCNTTATAEMTLTGTGYTLIEPKEDYEIIVNGIILNSDKSVSATNGADIEVYTATGLNDATVLEQLLKSNLVKLDTLPLIGLNICVPQGVWVNAKTNDATVNVTLLYYYRPL